MADAEKKSLSLRIDDTIEGLLLFFVRLVVTHARIAFLPFRPLPLLTEPNSDPPRFVRPLTFLAIGAFLFALLIDVYPAGFKGLIDLVWFGDEVKENVSQRWKEALSVTSLITAGMPIILIVAVLSAASSHVFFDAPEKQRQWYAASCYTFGYLTTALFLIMSADTLMQAITLLLPFVEMLGGWELLATALMYAGLLVLLMLAFVSPLVFLSRSFLLLRAPQKRASWIMDAVAGVVYWGLGIYLLAQAGSVVPNLHETYFPDPVPEVMIFEEMAVEHDPENDALELYFQVIVENPTSNDVLLELRDHDVLIALSESLGGPAARTWHLSPVHLVSRPGRLRTNRVVAGRGSYKLVELRATLPNLRAFYCSASELIRENERMIESGQLDSAYQVLRLVFEPNFRMRVDNQPAVDRMIDRDELFKFYSDDYCP